MWRLDQGHHVIPQILFPSITEKKVVKLYYHRNFSNEARPIVILVKLTCITQRNQLIENLTSMEVLNNLPLSGFQAIDLYS